MNLKTLLACCLFMVNFLLGMFIVPIIVASLVPETWMKVFYLSIILLTIGSLVLNFATLIVQSFFEQRMSFFQTSMMSSFVIKNPKLQKIVYIITERDLISFIAASGFSWFLGFSFVRRTYKIKTNKEMIGIPYYRNLFYATVINNIVYSPINYFFVVPISYFLLEVKAFLY